MAASARTALIHSAVVRLGLVPSYSLWNQMIAVSVAGWFCAMLRRSEFSSSSGCQAPLASRATQSPMKAVPPKMVTWSGVYQSSNTTRSLNPSKPNKRCASSIMACAPTPPRSLLTMRNAFDCPRITTFRSTELASFA